MLEISFMTNGIVTDSNFSEVCRIYLQSLFFAGYNNDLAFFTEDFMSLSVRTVHICDRKETDLVKCECTISKGISRMVDGTTATAV